MNFTKIELENKHMTKIYKRAQCRMKQVPESSRRKFMENCEYVNRHNSWN